MKPIKLSKILMSGFLDKRVASQVDLTRSVLITGFWRSGTTWIQIAVARLLDAKTVFEPFRPLFIDSSRGADAFKQERKGAAAESVLFMPYLEDRLQPGTESHELLLRAMRAEMSGGWIRRARRGISESTRKRVVVKLVRGQLSLKSLQRTYAIPLLHVHRDPRAIAASLKRLPRSWHGTPRDLQTLSLRQLLLNTGDRRRDFFDQWSVEIDLLDKEPPPFRAIAYWALTELYVESYQKEAKDVPMVSVAYEEVLRQDGVPLISALERLGLDPTKHRLMLDSDSGTSAKARRGASREERLTGWVEELTTDEIAKIEEIVTRCGLQHRLDASRASLASENE